MILLEIRRDRRLQGLSRLRAARAAPRASARVDVAEAQPASLLGVHQFSGASARCVAVALLLLTVRERERVSVRGTFALSFVWLKRKQSCASVSAQSLSHT
eukprot:6205261-Pleurochrysis_carterae.AAC.1